MNPMLVTQRTQKAFQAAVAELLRQFKGVSTNLFSGRQFLPPPLQQGYLVRSLDLKLIYLLLGSGWLAVILQSLLLVIA